MTVVAPMPATAGLMRVMAVAASKRGTAAQRSGGAAERQREQRENRDHWSGERGNARRLRLRSGIDRMLFGGRRQREQGPSCASLRSACVVDPAHQMRRQDKPQGRLSHVRRTGAGARRHWIAVLVERTLVRVVAAGQLPGR